MKLKITKIDYYSGYDANTFLALANLQHKITMANVDMELLDAAVFWFTNIERQKHNLKQFQFHDKLRQTATLHSEQMKRHNFFSHENIFDVRYKTIDDRIDSVKDNTFQGFMSWGENIADYPVIKTDGTFKIGVKNWQWNISLKRGEKLLPCSYLEYAKNVIVGWMNSHGHRKNILNSDYEYLGCGCEKYEKQEILYFKLTQNFGGTLIDNNNPKLLKSLSFGNNVNNKFNSLLGDLGQKNKSNIMSDSSFEEIDDVAPSRTFHQLGILCLDGSGSMSETGNGGITLAESVNRAVREFLGYFKTSAYVNNFSIAVVTFDTKASVHTPTTELASIDDFADYNPMNGHGGGTYIGGALEEAEKLAVQFLNNPDANVIPHDVRIIVMSDSDCQYPNETKIVAERLKQNDKITLCSSLFTTKENIGNSDIKEARSVLQDISSGINFYKTVYGEGDLRQFFISSMSAKRKFSNEK